VVHLERPDLTPGPATPAYTPVDWPIAAALLQIPPQSLDAAPEEWMRSLRPVRQAGFDALELSSGWLRAGDLPAERLDELRVALQETGLAVHGLSVLRESILHPQRGEANLAFSHRTIDAAAALGVGIVCLGLHDPLSPEQRDVLWFWTMPNPPQPSGPEAWALAVSRFRELAVHAAEVGVELSLELYEENFLGTVDEAVRLLDDIDHEAVGLNPDLGNLVRHQGAIDTWEYMVSVTAPRSNYWHIKNTMRLEHPQSGLVLSAPAPLESGVIDYRRAVAYAVGHGFRGPFIVEHYGGDGLSVGATNRDYLRRILPRE
jgi:sugar phosphate isomerase/epimerase